MFITTAGGGAIAGGLLGAFLGGDSSSSRQMDRSPWGPAQPWLKQNLQAGQDLQNYYTSNPFNALQAGAYNNLFAQNDYINSAVPNLLMQLSNPVGFSRANPTAQPQQVTMPTTQAQIQSGQQQASAVPQMQPLQGLLGPAITQASTAAASAPAPAASSGSPAGIASWVGGGWVDPRTGAPIGDLDADGSPLDAQGRRWLLGTIADFGAGG